MSMMCFGDKSLDLSLPHIMGILNVTPDSFSDGGMFVNFDRALAHVELMINDGATMIDVGGESTRPGADFVSLSEELDRVVPVVEAIKARFDVVVSVDTSQAEVMIESALVGAGLINDVRALSKDGALAAAVKTQLPVCLMHMQGAPNTMQKNPRYESVVEEVFGYLNDRAYECISSGVLPNNIILDPGIGFGKTKDHNLILLNQLDKLVNLKWPVLVGASRKTLIGDVLNRPVEDRLFGSLGIHASSFERGASIFRVHDVRSHADLLTMMSRIKQEF
ncbi:dihydropteroate synthase [Marinomonas sp. 15G1-11]|uniref:Dihydropteroate synthase n=1 Tax=Marinomonas phaeophyticola TaxID=3004091 RepID=A0ABT4JRZ7_9GAMM|nr:dihydropteroate synthase [Marinomonas sp. 15G1-11]MCZ2721132.1 dihydropteroate synthase [Marinomonas sp. 15G1-11]